MFDSGRNWELFGYDVRDFRGLFLAAWRDLLAGEDSPVRRHLDDIVEVRNAQGRECYQAGKRCAATSASLTAILLPDDLVLTRTLQLPAAVEKDLDAALVYEIRANSPFPEEDTASGWRIAARSDAQITVQLALASRSAIMAYLAHDWDEHDSQRQEIWAQAGSHMLLMRGFGEGRRARRYRRRLLRTAGMLGAIAALLLAVPAVSALFDRLQLNRLQEVAARTEREAGEAVELRAALAASNDIVAAANEVLANYPSPLSELAHLTALLEDSAYLERFAMSGLQVELRGRAQDAAAVMKRLTDEEDYAEVTAPRAFSRVAGTDLEQFHLAIRLKQAPAP